MRSDYEYAVVGLGGLGSAAAYWLARRAGRDVIGLEQFELGHERGESEDKSRIFRLSYDSVPYVKLALEARRDWRVLEAEAGADLIVSAGGLDLWPSDTTLKLVRYQSAMRAAGVPFEMLDTASIMRRYPQIRVGPDVVGMFQVEGGIALAQRANVAHRGLARAHGATLLDHTKVTAVRPIGGEYEIELGEWSIRSRRLVIAAGPWSTEMLRWLGIELATKVTKEQVTYFAPDDPWAFAPGRFPVWIWMIAVNYYGFPALGGALKAARDRFEVVNPDTRSFESDAVNEADVRAFLENLMPGAAGSILRTKTCLLTLTPDLDLVLGEVPGHPGCYAVVGAGHAFKFASAIGRILAELAIDGRTASDISPFALNRRALAAATRLL